MPCDTGLSSLVTLFVNFALAADTAVGGDGGTKTRKRSIILKERERESVSVCVCVYVREREGERERVGGVEMTQCWVCVQSFCTGTRGLVSRTRNRQTVV